MAAAIEKSAAIDISAPIDASVAAERAAAIADPSVVDSIEVATALGTDLEFGLTSAEAARRLARDGANEIRAAPGVSAWRRALAQLQDPMVYLLLVAAAVALAAWAVEGQHGWPMDAIVIAAVVVLNAVLGWFQGFIRHFRGLIYAVARGFQGERDGQQGAIPGVVGTGRAVGGGTS